ncbi:MAG: hypothetical protein ACOYO1_02495 [Bacteroidales bacterium]
MIYIPRYSEPKFSYMGEGAAIGSAVGSVVPGIGTAAGAVVGTIVDVVGSIFGGGKKSQWSENNDDQNEKLVTTLLYDGIWNKKLGFTSSDELIKYVWQTLNDNGVFTGKEQSYGAWLEGNKDWVYDRAYFLRGLSSTGGVVVNHEIYDMLTKWNKQNIQNLPPLAMYNNPSITSDIVLKEAAPTPPPPASQTENATASKPGATTPLTTEQKAAKTKSYWIYGGIGLTVIVIIVVVVIILKKKGK